MTAGAAADRRDEVFPSSGARVVQVLGPAAESWEWWRERPPGHSEFQDSSINTPANSGNNPSLSGYSRVPAGGARNQRLIRFVDQIFVHPLNRIVWYKISVISTHTDTKTSVSARKAAYLTVNVTQFTHTGSKLFRDLCKTRQLPRLRGGQLYIAVGGRKVKLDWLCAAVLQSSDAIAPHCSAVAKTHCSIPTNSQTTVKLLPEAWSQDMDQDI